MEGIASALDIGLLSAVLAVALLGAWQLGRWLGRHRRDAQPSKFDDAAAALLGLLLAFTFGMSIARHDQRRTAVVADANSIGDFYTCVSLLKDPIRTQLQAVIRQYVQLRLELVRGNLRTPQLENALIKFERMHVQMTELVAQAISDGTPIAVSLSNTLNGLSSNQASRLAAYRDRLPNSIVILLFASAVITALLIGRDQGARGSSDVAGTLCFILLVSLTIYVTLDLNQPERGFIRVSQEPIERLLSSMPK
jgi:hypothetical protein